MTRGKSPRSQKADAAGRPSGARSAGPDARQGESRFHSSRRSKALPVSFTTEKVLDCHHGFELVLADSVQLGASTITLNPISWSRRAELARQSFAIWYTGGFHVFTHYLHHFTHGRSLRMRARTAILHIHSKRGRVTARINAVAATLKKQGIEPGVIDYRAGTITSRWFDTGYRFARNR